MSTALDDMLAVPNGNTVNGECIEANETLKTLLNKNEKNYFLFNIFHPSMSSKNEAKIISKFIILLLARNVFFIFSNSQCYEHFSSFKSFSSITSVSIDSNV